jgi:two-component system, sensor histidine kinase and response regulator
MTLAGRYDPWLVTLSVIIAILASGAALDLAGRVVASRGAARLRWLAVGSLAMGLGIWCMHYTGMLAFEMETPVEYHVITVVWSFVAAVMASAVALFVASRERLDPTRLAAGSLVMGSGIAAMHYTGMAAMRMDATIAWNPILVAASIVIAVLVAGVALWLAFRHGHAGSVGWGWGKVGSAILMGLAIPSMHYTGMAAARFVTADKPIELSGTVTVSELGAGAIGVGTLFVLLLAIASSLFDRRLLAEREVAAERQRILIGELQVALTEVRTLRGLLPICANCKRIRTDAGGWEQVESYVREHTHAEFSHAICPDCVATLYG